MAPRKADHLHSPCSLYKWLIRAITVYRLSMFIDHNGVEMRRSQTGGKRKSLTGKNSIYISISLVLRCMRLCSKELGLLKKKQDDRVDLKTTPFEPIARASFYGIDRRRNLAWAEREKSQVAEKRRRCHGHYRGRCANSYALTKRLFTHF